MDCIFCKIIKGELPTHKIYEDEAAEHIKSALTMITNKQHNQLRASIAQAILGAIAKKLQAIKMPHFRLCVSS